MITRSVFVSCFFLLISSASFSQRTIVQKPPTRPTPTTTAAERTSTSREVTPTTNSSTQKKEKGKFKANWKLPYPNPYRAAIYSMVIPGAGQIYNKRYWKAPIVWGGFAALIYSVDYNKGFVDRFDLAYGLRLTGEPDEFIDIIPNAETLKRQRNLFRKNLQTTYMGFIGMYVIGALDAYVDAHLKAFDISDDLSLHIQPTIGGSATGNTTFGLGFVFELH